MARLDDVEIRRLLGQRIRHLRQERGLTQQVLAQRTAGRASQKHIGAVERGQGAPSATFLVRIAQALEVTVGELFETITPESSRLPRKTIASVRESLQSLVDTLEALNHLANPPDYATPHARPRRRRSSRLPSARG